MGNDARVVWLFVIPLVGVFVFWLIGLGVYTARVVHKGRYRSAKVDEKGGTVLIGRWLMEFGYWMIHWPGRWLAHRRVNPNSITIGGLIVSLAAAAGVYLGWFGLGGWLLIAAGVLDVLDGMVARETGQASSAGVFLDTVTDRYCELCFFVAAMGYYFPLHPLLGLVVGLALVASVMITFTRTKGEAMGITDLPSGLMRRHERLLFLGVGTAASPLVALELEPGVQHPVFHLAVLAHAVVGLVGIIAAIQLEMRIFQRLHHQQRQRALASRITRQASAPIRHNMASRAQEPMDFLGPRLTPISLHRDELSQVYRTAVDPGVRSRIRSAANKQ